MRPTIPLRPLWRHNHPRRTITTAPGTFANIRYELLARPPKCYYDYLTPTNSHLLSVTLADQLAPLQARRPYPPPTSSDLDHWTLPKVHHRGGDAAAQPLPQGHHLVYFPPTHPSSALLADGTDADHWPGPPFTRRLWAGGSVSFAPHWADQLLLDKRRAACVERVEDVRLTWTRPAAAAPADGAGDDGGSAAFQAAGDKVFVDVVRRYGWVGPEEDVMGGREVVRRVEGDPAIVERRTLVFLPGKADEASPGRRNGTKPRREFDFPFCVAHRVEGSIFVYNSLSNHSRGRGESLPRPGVLHILHGLASRVVPLQRVELQRPCHPPRLSPLPRGGGLREASRPRAAPAGSHVFRPEGCRGGQGTDRDQGS